MTGENMASLFKTDIRMLKGVGPKIAELFKKLGVPTVGALINFYPRAYEDWTTPQSAANVYHNKVGCIQVKITSGVISRFLNGGKSLHELEAISGSDTIKIIFFNSKYTAESLKVGEEYLLKGPITKNLLGYKMINPKIKSVGNEIGLEPVYSLVKGISSAKIIAIVKNALELLPEDINDTLPKEILSDYNLCSLYFALKNIHFPKDKFILKQARDRLVFEEFFIYQLSMNMLKKQARKKTNILVNKDFSDEFYFLLPFQVTNAQKRTVNECVYDMKDSGFSMNRLLQGDVGSGKTAVAAALAYTISKNNFQTAFMAPTEILAAQHYKTFSKLFEGTNINTVLICGSTKPKEKEAIKEKIISGEVNIIIGTHALISESTKFNNLGLVITDEQHRFGVKQRSNLVSKGKDPHVLVMSATPIPRTLAMILYGDLDISILDELPPGRQKIDTFHIDESKRKRALNFLRDLVAVGQQGYIVCACIEENENEIADVKSYKEKLLKEGFSDEDVAVIHGKMKPAEKDEIMQRFIANEIKVLVSTTVIEVGVDVPNAAVMIIENAERFGISQLHQLRGRVGRGSQKSYCILISNSRGKESYKRFSAMVHSNDGFYLSEEDLKLRGPGDFFGENQHGVPNIKIATSYEDIKLMKMAQEATQNISDLSDPGLKFIKNKIEKVFKNEDGNDSGVVF